ncbi:MAG: hypothetical protein GF308_06685 [Candidatus Heimdallarchaeota archaeon]|nr:hypothetical protein [Candidatus Heimdallarchaeota archaeon]
MPIFNIKYILKRIPVVLNAFFNHLTPKMIHGLLIKEIQYKRKVAKKLQDLNWSEINLQINPYSANWSFLYVLLEFLTEKKPKKILELGSGETTKLTYKFVQENPNKTALVLEENKEWYNQLEKKFRTPRFEYLHKPLVKKKVAGHKTTWYSYEFANQKKLFNLIIIDGPTGTYNYSRLGIVKYLTDILHRKDFLIMLDDSKRRGEKQTLKMIKKKLQSEEIDYASIHCYGRKRQTCIFSPNLESFFNQL